MSKNSVLKQMETDTMEKRETHRLWEKFEFVVYGKYEK